MKNTYKFGDIPVEIEYRGDYFEEKAKDYITDEEPLFSLSARIRNKDRPDQRHQTCRF